MQVFKIYCGLDTNGYDVNASQIAHDLAAKCFPYGHTVYEANGRWMGEVGVIDEPTLVIEVLSEDDKVSREVASNAVSRFAGCYKEQAFQESVLVTQAQQSAWFV